MLRKASGPSRQEMGRRAYIGRRSHVMGLGSHTSCRARLFSLQLCVRRIRPKRERQASRARLLAFGLYKLGFRFTPPELISGGVIYFFICFLYTICIMKLVSKNILYGVFILLAIATLYSAFVAPVADSKEISLSELVGKINAGEVEEIAVEGSRLDIILKDKTLLISKKEE